MKQLRYFSAFFLTVIFMSFMGCASTAKQEGTGEYVDDSVITTKVKAAKDQAVEVARGVKGVKSVKDDMRLK
jgi:osmotically-inducible protein OsmY